MALTTDLRPRQRTAPLEYALLLALVAALTSVAVVGLGMLGSGRMTEAGSCLTSSVCTIGGISSAPGQPRR